MLLREQVRAKTLFAKLQQEYREAESACKRDYSVVKAAGLSRVKKQLDDAERNLKYQFEKWAFLNNKGLAIMDHGKENHLLSAKELQWNKLLNEDTAAASAAEASAAAAARSSARLTKLDHAFFHQ